MKKFLIGFLIFFVVSVIIFIFIRLKNNKNNEEVSSNTNTNNNKGSTKDPCEGFKYDYSLVLKKGDKGCNVRMLQRDINKYGGNLVVDGIFGQKTENELYRLVKRKTSSIGMLNADLYR
jgi:hypothetical protein